MAERFNLYEQLIKHLTLDELKMLEEKGFTLRSNLFDPKYDAVFKAILTSSSDESKKALLSLLSCILGRKILSAELSNNEIAVEGVDQKQSVMDIHCRLDDNSEVNIEMAMCNNDDYVNAAEYRVCKLFGAQSIKGRAFGDLNKVYGIMILNFTLFQDRQESFDEYMYRNPEGRVLSNNTQIIYVELTKLDRVLKKSVQDMTGAEKWAVFFKYGNDPTKKDLIDEIRRGEEGIAMVIQVLESISNNRDEQVKYISRMMAEAHETSSRIHMERRAKQEGIMEGRIEGLKEGEIKGKISIAKKLLQAGDSIEKVQMLTDLPLETIQDLAQSAKL